MFPYLKAGKNSRWEHEEHRGSNNKDFASWATESMCPADSRDMLE